MLLLAVEHYGYVAGGLSNASSVQQLAALAFILCVSRLVLFYLKKRRPISVGLQQNFAILRMLHLLPLA